MVKQYEYDFDAYGTNANNLIENEVHTITPINGVNFAFFIPKKAPFHRRSVVVKNALTGARLNPGTDYYFGWRYDEVILGGAVQPVYGCIVLNDPSKSTQVSIDYHTVGGPTVIDSQQLAQLLANTTRDPRRALWTDVVDIPDELPPVPHRQSTGDLVGFDVPVEVLYKIADAIAEGNVKAMQALMEHVKDHHNPHKITLEDLGIDELGSIIPASREEAEEATNETHYMTPVRTDQYAQANIVPIIDKHKEDQTNPHNVTKDQVGLSNVENYKIASAEEAEAGVANNRYMTPELTKMMLEASVGPSMANHINDMNNPHKVTKTQVGLGNVQNYKLATDQEAGAGTSTTSYMTPYLVSISIGALTADAVRFHTEDMDNPHSVTKSQVGLGQVENYPPATLSDALAGTPGHYITADVLSKVIDVNGGGSGGSGGSALTAHIEDHDNPHEVTKAQVGLNNVENYTAATAQDVLDFKRDPTYMTTESMALWLADNGGWANYINTERLHLEKVKNYPIATDADILSNSNEAYATPAVVTKMMESDLVTNPMLTAMNIDISTYTGIPYSFVEVTESYMVDARWRGFMVSYDIGESLDDYAYLFADHAFDADVSYNSKLTDIATGYGAGISFFSITTSDNDYYRLALWYAPQTDGSYKIQLVSLVDGEFKVINDTGKTATGTLNGMSIGVNLVYSSQSYSIEVLTMDGTMVKYEGTLKTLLAAIGISDDNAVLGGAYGFIVGVDKADAVTSGVTYSSNWIPNTDDGLLYNVDNRKRWSFTGRKWQEGEFDPDETTDVSYRPSTMYWNSMTDELFIACTHRHAIAVGMSSYIEDTTT